MDPALHARFLEYAQDVVRTFAGDKRILAWDVWNEPDNVSTSSGAAEPAGKVAAVMAVLPTVFEWVRAGVPTQPLTSGLWKGDWSAPDKLSPMEKMQIELSDVISFHNYDAPEEFEKRVRWLPGLQSADSVHGVHGAPQPEHLPGDPAGGQEVQGGGLQLGPG